MLEIYPVGARCWVKEVAPVDEIQQWSRRTGLVAVQLDSATPRPTTGYVVAVGNDPLLQEMLKVGDLVFYGKYAGEHVQVKGETYRCLGMHEITSIARGSEKELQELTTPPAEQSLEHKEDRHDLPNKATPLPTPE